MALRIYTEKEWEIIEESVINHIRLRTLCKEVLYTDYKTLDKYYQERYGVSYPRFKQKIIYIYKSF